MKRFLVASIALILSFTLSGCIKFDLALEINRDSTVSGTFIYAVSDALASLGTNSDITDPTSSFVDAKAEGVTASEYKQGGFTGTKITLDHVPLSAFDQPGSDVGQLKIVRNGNTVTLKGVLDLTSADSNSSSGSEWGDEIANSILSSADLNISVKFPVKVLSTTGRLSEDGQTVSWKPKIGEKIDLTTSVELPKSNFKNIGIAGILLTIVLVLVAGFQLKRRKSQQITYETEGGINSEEIIN